MPEITLTVRHEVGLHARPAALLVQTAKRFNCDVKVTHDEREANAKSILSVLTLRAERGTVIIIRAERDDTDLPFREISRNRGASAPFSHKF